jgi:hypothetical protein
MDPDMACRTISIPWIRHVVRCRLHGYAIRLPAEVPGTVMALQTHSKHDGPLEQPCIHGAMRGMTGLATVNPNSRMLIEEWSTFVGVALQTRLLVLQARIHQVGPPAHFPGRSICAVWIVAVRAAHKPLVHPVLEGLRKLCPNIVMTPVADVGLPFGEEIPVGIGLMNGMAGSADDVRLRVIAASNVGAVQILGVATETGIQDLIRRQIGECDDSLLAAFCIDMLLARSMAAFATGVLDRSIGGYVGLVVRVPKELQGDVRVTGPASGTPRVRWIGSPLRRRLAESRESGVQEQEKQNQKIES